MNSYSGCMDGDPATSVILDAYSKGIKGFDVEKAYAGCKQTAAGANGSTNRPENDFYLKHGYVPDNAASPGVSWTLDNAHFDWCVGRLAEALGKTEDAQLFSARAANYKNIYDPVVGSMRARNAAGEWIPWLGKTAFGQGCTGSNPLQQTWFVPHDVAGLIELMGGRRSSLAGWKSSLKRHLLRSGGTTITITPMSRCTMFPTYLSMRASHGSRRSGCGVS